jgi:hypothetical protein
MLSIRTTRVLTFAYALWPAALGIWLAACTGDNHHAGDGDAGTDCAHGEIVESKDRCYTDVSCVKLDDGRWCTGGESPRCPVGARRIDPDDPCPAHARCDEFAIGLSCAFFAYTLEECRDLGGAAVSDKGDGSLVRNGCPHSETLGGLIGVNFPEGGLCCATEESD